ncbi:hypothetical protein K438DRAFT_1555904 [Mycena galopus ATCC 62051]|nr:hypothetical protein K438DRAFT_1555904 [Mycena galopus ATCC 62051]
MASEFPSAVIGKGPSWKGFNALKFLVIFGASYCDVGFEYANSPIPSYDQPLGIEFPGATYAEPNAPNWVGHLITKYAPQNKLLVYNYAKGGSRVYSVKNQIEVMFKRQISLKPASAPWAAEDTLFITWVGINDAAWGNEHEENLQKLFEAQEFLYNSDARNFLFVNVPPINRAPGNSRFFAPSYVNWNTELKKASSLFATAHPDATVMIYSSWDTFNALLDAPGKYGFPAEDVCKANASIWVDHLHPTSRVHDCIARDMSAFLATQAAFE